MNVIANDYSLRAPPVTIVPTPQGATVLNLQADPSLRTIGRSTASRGNGAQPQAQTDPEKALVADAFAGDSTGKAHHEPARSSVSVDLYRRTQTAGAAPAYHRIDLYA